MSTRSRIGLSTGGGKIRSIYCHFDGYPEGVGKTLAEHYNTVEKVKALLDLGDISVLGPDLGEDQGTGWFDDRLTNGPLDPSDPRRSWTVAYGRDRGEEGVKSKTHGYFDWPDSGQQYEYVFYPEDGWAMTRGFILLSQVGFLN